MFSDAWIKKVNIAYFMAAAVLIGLSLWNHPSPVRFFTYKPPHELFDVLLVNLENFTIKTIAVLCVNYLIVSLFGLSLIRSFFKDIKGAQFLNKCIASFCIGYLCTVGLVRVLSIFVDYSAIYMPQ